MHPSVSYPIIDDSIKLSNILGGAHSVFRDVFEHDFEGHQARGRMASGFTTL
jgi:hypothetical protein